MSGLAELLAEARRREALYWPAYAAERAGRRLALPAGPSRLLARLLAARGKPLDWIDLAPAVRFGRACSLNENDEILVRVQVSKLRAALALGGFANAILTLTGAEPHGYAVAPGLGAEILQRLGVAPAPDATPSPNPSEAA